MILIRLGRLVRCARSVITPSSEAPCDCERLLSRHCCLSGATLWASDYLTEGVDPGRTGWMKDEKIFTTANVEKHEAVVEDQARQHAARDAQPLRAAHRREA